MRTLSLYGVVVVVVVNVVGVVFANERKQNTGRQNTINSRSVENIHPSVCSPFFMQQIHCKRREQNPG